MVLPYHPAGWQVLVQRLAAMRTGSRLLAPILHHQRVDQPIIRLSHGKTSLTSLLTGLPVVTLTTIGAKSGKPRSVPLVAIPLISVSPGLGVDKGSAQEKIVLIASNFGRQRHPAWYYNLRANPLASLSLSGLGWLPHETSGEEREAYWQQGRYGFSLRRI